MITHKADSYFSSAETLVRSSIDFQDFSFNLHIFQLAGRRLPVNKPVVCTAVDLEYATKNGDVMLAGQGSNGF